MKRNFRILKLRNPVKFICLFGSCLFVIIQVFTVLQLIKFDPSTKLISSTKQLNLSKEAQTFMFGEMMMDMLPEDLPFSLFLPSEKGFERDLRLNPSDSLTGESANDTLAILTRVLGFSAVPRWILAKDLEVGKEMTYISISGFDLFVSKDSNGILTVNGVKSEKVDLKMGKNRYTVVHVMDGVIMDAELEESMQPDDEEDDQN